MGQAKLEGSSGHGGYAFGPFVVDSVKRRLWRDGRLVPITSKTFDVLIVLLEHRDHIVSKDELLNRVWPNTAVNENNLARQISSLRRALGQRPDQHDFVVTIPGHGYRFVATVQSLTDAPPELRGRDVHLHVPPEPSMEGEDSRAGVESLCEGSVAPVGGAPGSPTGPTWRWTSSAVVVATTRPGRSLKVRTSSCIHARAQWQEARPSSAG